MSWSEYVKRVAGDADQGTIAKAAKVGSPTVSRWLSETQGVKPEAAANFARHYKRPVLEAFVAAGFLTPAEAKQRPAAEPSLSSLTEVDLIREILRRAEGRGEHGGDTAATSNAGGGPGGPGLRAVAEHDEKDPLDEAEETERST